MSVTVDWSKALGRGASPSAAAEISAIGHGKRFVSPSGDTSGVADRAAIDAVVSAGLVAVLGDADYYLATPGVSPAANSGIEGGGMWRTAVHKVGDVTGGAGAVYVNSGAPNAFVDGLLFRDFRLVGTSDTDGFSEFQHLMSLSGVRNAVIDSVGFVGYQGDGIYLGSGIVAGHERHNKNVVIRGCHFDGLNNENRGGVSVIDVDGLLVQGCYFANSTKSTMPGALDIEPDAQTFHVVRGVEIVDNRFRECGGSNGSISVVLPDVAYSTQPSGFLISGNDSSSASVDNGIFFNHVGDATSSRNHALRIIHNRVAKSKRGIWINGVRGALIAHNDIDETSSIPSIGDTYRCQDVRLIENRWNKLSTTVAGTGLKIQNIDYLDIIRNTFIDCGLSNGGGGYAIDFDTGYSSYVSMLGNRFLNPGSKTSAAVVKEAGHTFDAATNREADNDLVGCTGWAFSAAQSDLVEQSWTPTVSGAGTAGAGTYTTQFGRYRRHGKWVMGYCRIVLSNHTGSGTAVVALPVTPATAGKSGNPQVLSVVDAANITNGEKALHAQLNADVSGAVLTYNTSGGAASNVQISAITTATIAFSFAYLAA